MDRLVDYRPPVREAPGSPQPSHLWDRGLASVEEGMLVGPRKSQYSYWAECECPGYCLRDHENE